jgi:two-component system nitrate/nitrite response regulator NarL
MGENTSALPLVPLTRQIRVVVADPYPVIVHGVRTMIEEDLRFRVVAEAASLPSLMKKAKAEPPDVALVDWAMAAQDLAAATALLQSELRSTAVVFLTVSENSQEKQEMLRQGAQAFVSKWCSPRTLQKAVWKACREQKSQGSSPPKPTVTAPHGQAQRAIQQLTGRERQLLPLVCSGLRNKEIAARLEIAETTVWHHLTAIFIKLQVEDRLGLAAFVYRHGMLPPPIPDKLPPGGKTDQAQLWKYPPQGLSVDGLGEASQQG